MREGENGGSIAPDYILVALDASPHSTAALIAAAELAAVLHLELRGIYVEDVNLLHLCGMPFGLEIGLFTANPRRLEQARMERDFRVQATQLRKSMADIAGQRRLSWSFQVVRGGVTQELLSAGSTAQMVSLGRVGMTPGKRTGSTAQAVARNTQRPVILQAAQQPLGEPFTVVYLGDTPSVHALQLANQLARPRSTPLQVWTLAELHPQLTEALAVLGEQLPAPVVQYYPTSAALAAALAQTRSGSVLLPVAAADWLDAMGVTVIVVP
jgi:nucleotide-binding universal stress UspA family protein